MVKFRTSSRLQKLLFQCSLKGWSEKKVGFSEIEIQNFSVAISRLDIIKLGFDSNMLTGNETCRVCDGATFEEVEGEFFCTICNTQLEGYKTEKTDENELLGVRLKKVKSERRRKKRPPLDMGLNWTTYDAFNLILVEHLRVLTSDCGLPDLLRKVVLTIWSTYLQRTQVAFVDGSKDDPKLSALIRRRDVAILSRKVPKLPQPRFKDGCIRDELGAKKRMRYGNFVVLQKRATQVDDYVTDETRRTCHYRKKGTYTYDGIPTAIKSEFGFSSKNYVVDSSDSDESSQEVNSYGHKIILEDEEEEEESQDEEETYNYFDKKVPFSQLNNFSKLMTRVAGSDYKNKKAYAGSKAHSDYMDMSKLISMIYLGIRIIDLDIHLSVLLRWIDEGVLPFNKGVNCLPKNWVRVSTDANSFGKFYSSITTRNIIETTCNLHSFLAIPSLPEVDMMHLLQDQLYHLNLPSDIINLMCTDDRFTSYLNKAGKARKVDTFLRHFELTTFAVLFVLLRKLFRLDETILDIHERDDSHFDFFSWLSHTRLKIFMITNHIIPTYRQSFGDFNDTKAMNAFYEMVVKDYRARHIAHIQHDHWMDDQVYIDMSDVVKKMIDHDLLNRISGTDNVPMSDGVTRKPSKYFLIESTKRLISKSVSDPVKLKLEENYRDKSLRYFGHDSRLITNYEDLVIGGIDRDRSGKLKSSPSVDLVAVLGIITFRFDNKDLVREVGRVERTIFHKHNPDTRVFNSYIVRVRKRNWV